MAEINGYILTKEEEKACAELVKELRARKVFDIEFTGHLEVKAKTYEEANSIFWDWVEDMHEKTYSGWNEVGVKVNFTQYSTEEE